MTAREGDFRDLVVTLWYPAVHGENAGNKCAQYVDHIEAWISSLGDESAQALAAVVVNAAKDAPVADIRDMRLLVFSPGRGMNHWQYTILAEDLASHGWSVAIIDHTHMGKVSLKGARLIGPHPDWDPPPELYQESPERIDAFWDEMHPYLAADVSFVLDQLSKLPATHPLAGQLQLSKVGTTGHSRGTSPAFRSALIDSRVVACAGFDALGSPKERNGALAKPFLNIRSDGDWTARQPYLDQLYGNVKAPAYDVVLKGFDHNACTDMAFLASIGDARNEHVQRVRTASAWLRAFFQEALSADGGGDFRPFAEAQQNAVFTIHQPAPQDQAKKLRQSNCFPTRRKTNGALPSGNSLTTPPASPLAELRLGVGQSWPAEEARSGYCFPYGEVSHWAAPHECFERRQSAPACLCNS